jgi:hypothetical protein
MIAHKLEIEGLDLFHVGKVHEVVQGLLLQVVTDCLVRSDLREPRKLSIAFEFAPLPHPPERCNSVQVAVTIQGADGLTPDFAQVYKFPWQQLDLF